MTSASVPRAAPQTAQVLTERYGPAYRWLVTITGMIGVVSMVLAMTTVNVAVPDVMGAFGIGQDKAQWMSSAYMATMTAGMLMNAWITGVLGERRAFVGSLFFFSIGALFGGSAPTEDVLILFFDKNDRLTGRIDAKQARLETGHWRITNGTRWQPGRPQEPFTEITIATSMTASKIEQSFASPETMSFWDLPGFIALLQLIALAATVE